MKHALTGLLISFTLGAFSQAGQTDWWYFGAQAGVHFNTAPSAVTNGQVNTQEGVATISNAAGQLLFYSDGITVYNANHAVMTNGTGLMGNGSSAQSGVVVPRPGSNTEYYLFTVAAFGSNNGMRYSHIDMSASSGLGAVTTTQKNVWIMPNPTEKIAVIPKTGGYWVLCPKHSSDTMYAFPVTSGGIGTPVKTATGVTTPNPAGSVSYLKPNLQGTRLVGGSYGATVITLYTFNKQNGVITSAFNFTGGTSTYSNYGVEFSPNGNMVYAQGWGAANCRQYDITSNNATTISSSVVNLGPNANGGGGGAIQLGRDGKMYLSRYGQTYLDRINSPDVSGTGCGYVANAVSLSNRQCRWGLPTFIQAYFGATVTSEQFCFGDSTIFTADTTNVDSMYWVFGDPNSGASNFAWTLEAGHIYSDTGTFNVQLVIFGNGLSDTIHHQVLIYPRQTADLGNDTTLCAGLEFTLNVDQPYATYLWHDNSTDSAYTVSVPDNMVWVKVFGVCDTVSDTINVNFVYPFTPDLGPDHSICTYESEVLDPQIGSGNYQYAWNTGNTASTQFVDGPGTYMVTVTDSFGICSFSDTVTIANYPEVKIELGNDSSFCYEPVVELVPDVQNVVSYAWSTGSTSNTLYITQSGTYTVTAYGVGNHCQMVDDVRWNLYFLPQVDLGPDKSFCHDETYTIDTDHGFPHTFFWNNGTIDSTLTVNMVGLYWVEVSDTNCSMRDTIILDHFPILDVTLGEDIKTCEGKSLTLTPWTSIPVSSYEWSNGSSGPNLNVSGHGSYSVTVSNGFCDAEDIINVFYFDYPPVDLGNDTMVCEGAEWVKDVKVPAQEVTYEWNDGTVDHKNVFKAADSTWYWVKLTNVVCESSDSVFVVIREVPSTDLGRDTAICEGDEITLRVPSDQRIVGYQWSTGADSETIRVSKPGTYVVLVNDTFCTTPGEITITVRAVPSPEDIELDLPETICIGEQFHLEKKHPLITAYEWQDGSTLPSHTVSKDGIYWLKATHRCGVMADTAIVAPCECPVWLPTAFNPDGDGNNEKFVPESDCPFTSYKFTIFDRWGEKVFYSEDPTQSWDGTYRGYESQGGVYTWTLSYEADEKGRTFEASTHGTVVLLR